MQDPSHEPQPPRIEVQFGTPEERAAARASFRRTQGIVRVGFVVVLLFFLAVATAMGVAIWFVVTHLPFG